MNSVVRVGHGSTPKVTIFRFYLARILQVPLSLVLDKSSEERQGKIWKKNSNF